jgi:hypothetical protein
MGGAIFNLYGSVHITNSTLTGNTAQGGSGGRGGVEGGNGGSGGSGFGGAVFNLDGSVTLNNATVAANTVTPGAAGAAGDPNATAGSPGGAAGGAIYNLALGKTPTGGTIAAPLTLTNSILSNTSGGRDLASTGITGPAPIGGSSTLVQSNSFSNSSVAPGVITIVADPNLGPLASNGGPTQTMLPAAGSPVLGAGNPAVSGLPATDQRGLPRVVHDQVDLGAVEVQTGGQPNHAPGTGHPHHQGKI